MSGVTPYVVVFAGVPGSSKSIVAYSLSASFGLPIFSTDNLRFEVKEDLMVSSINEPRALQEYERRQAKRWADLLAVKKSFIRDGSVDRKWPEIKKSLQEAGYEFFMIDMELSETFLNKLYCATGRPQALEELPAYLEQHHDFMLAHSSDVSLQISDDNFLKRNELAEAALKRFLSGVE